MNPPGTAGAGVLADDAFADGLGFGFGADVETAVDEQQGLVGGGDALVVAGHDVGDRGQCR